MGNVPEIVRFLQELLRGRVSVQGLPKDFDLVGFVCAVCNYEAAIVAQRSWAGRNESRPLAGGGGDSMDGKCPVVPNVYGMLT